MEPVPTNVKAKTNLMIHLGYIIKSRELLRLGERVRSVLHQDDLTRPASL